MIGLLKILFKTKIYEYKLQHQGLLCQSGIGPGKNWKENLRRANLLELTIVILILIEIALFIYELFLK